MPILQELTNEQGISRQAIWLKTKKGKAYLKAYRQTDKFKAYWRIPSKNFLIR